MAVLGMARPRNASASGHELEASSSFVMMNCLRTAVAKKEGGHVSPLAASHEKSDSFLVYDVARYTYAPS